MLINKNPSDGGPTEGEKQSRGRAEEEESDEVDEKTSDYKHSIEMTAVYMLGL